MDDSETNLWVAENALQDRYHVVTLCSAAKLFAFLETARPDCILLDIQMPGMDGLEALRYLKAQDTYADIPVILLTSLTDAAVEACGFELGAADFITKPFSPPVLQNRIKTHLDVTDLIRERTAQLEQRTMQLDRLQSGVVFTLADLIESRDRDTGGHVERTTSYIRLLLDAMVVSGTYADELCDWNLEVVASSARLHDMGKIAIPDGILNKPGPLSAEEFATMKTHTQEGERIIEQIITRTGDVEFLRSAKLFAGYHHEHWDGTGYPHGLKETEIPLQGRMMTIVDVYDALVSERPYKKAFTSEEAMRIIMNDVGKRFDPRIAQVFCGIQDQLRRVGAGLHSSSRITWRTEHPSPAQTPASAQDAVTDAGRLQELAAHILAFELSHATPMQTMNAVAQWQLLLRE